MRSYLKCFILLLAVFGLCQIASAEIVLHYEFEGDLTDSANGYNGTIIAGDDGLGTPDLGYTASPNGGLALDLGGSTCIDVPLAATATLDADATIACWIKSDDATHNEVEIFGIKNSSWGRLMYANFPWYGTMYFDTPGGRVSGAITAEELTGWNHWAFTRNSATGTQTVYLNGQIWGQATGQAMTSMAGADRFRVGGGDWPSRSLVGLMDDFRLYDTELTQSEIQALIPEPASLTLLAFGSLALARRKK